METDDRRERESEWGPLGALVATVLALAILIMA